MAMKRYTALRLLTLNVGAVVELNDKQARDRTGRIERVGKADPKAKDRGGRYKLLESLQFKAGEQFGLEGDLPRALADHLVTPEQQAAADAKAKTDAEAAEREAIERARPAVVQELLAQLKPETAATVKAELELAAKGDAGKKSGWLGRLFS